MASRAYRLKAKEDAAGGVKRIALGRSEKALERLGSTDDGELAAAIHGARKDLKKLRSLLRLVRDELGGRTFKAENRRYRDAGRLLSGSRDAEVKLETLTALRHRFGDGLPGDAAARWEGALEAERDELASSLRDRGEGQIGQAIAAIEAGQDAIREWSLRSGWPLLGPGIRRSYEDGREAMKQALAEPSVENLHRWRKRAKDLWYQLRIVHDAWPEVLGATVEQAHELTDLLGDHHDLAVLAEDLRSRAGFGARDEFEGAIEERQSELLDGATAIGRRLYAEKPKAFRRRIKRYWLAWRQF